MKLTLDIPNEHAPRLLALLADLMPVRLDPQADPAEGHPELPLSPFAPETINNLRQIGSYNPPTMPVAEWAEKQMVESAAQPGKTGLALKQIARVMGDEISLDAQPDDESEEIAETRWAPVPGIDAADPLKVEMEAVHIDPTESFKNASTVSPVVGKRFYTRNGCVVLIESIVSSLQYKGSYCGRYYYYNKNGQTGVGRHFDLVQQCPF